MDTGPSLSTDELTLYYRRDGGPNGTDIAMATRPAKSSPWTKTEFLASTINSGGAGSPEISRDGLLLAYDSAGAGTFGGSDLWLSRRPTLKSYFGFVEHLKPPVNSAGEERAPCLSADGRVLLFDSQSGEGHLGNRDLYMSMRTTLTSPWKGRLNLGTTINGPGSAGDAEPTLSADGRTLIYARSAAGGNDLWESHRVPKNSTAPTGN
jgi:hypothetical protein